MNKRVIGISILVLALIGAGVWFYIYMYDTADHTAVIPQTQEPPRLKERPAPESPVQDVDWDGISDEDEATLGTDPQRIDTDGDGLSDKQEIDETKTDPTKADTDGDGFSDLTELSNGYDPLVP